MSHTDPVTGSLLGAMSSVIGMITDMIPAQNALEAVVLAVIGATAGFFTNMLLRRIFKRKPNEPTK